MDWGCQLLLLLAAIPLSALDTPAGYFGSVFSSTGNPFCWKNECCNSDWIIRDVEALHGNLTEHLFGQHLVADTILRSLGSHVRYGSQRPLVFSLHGSCGTGKSFVSRLVAKNWFKKGLDSDYLHLRIGTKDYPFTQDLGQSKKELQDLVEWNVRQCPYQMFIFEEVDSFPMGLLDALTPFLTSHGKISGVDYTKSIFILISNTGQKSINDKTWGNFLGGTPRESLAYREMEQIMEEEIYNSENSGLRRSKLIDKFHISFFLPFLPLERKHVTMCVERVLRQRLNRPPEIELVREVMAELSFQDPDSNFARKGCKNVDEKVNYILGARTFKQHSPTTEL